MYRILTICIKVRQTASSRYFSAIKCCIVSCLPPKFYAIIFKKKLKADAYVNDNYIYIYEEKYINVFKWNYINQFNHTYNKDNKI